METLSTSTIVLSLYRVLTVPMRNGNNDDEFCQVMLEYRSYRTYEEWKHYNVSYTRQVVLGSYRTYEEWKQ